MKAFVFPGQGSQSVGMGKDLYNAFPTARDVFLEVDDALGQKLTRIMFEGDPEELTLTENAQPALMAVSMAVWRVLQKDGGLDLENHVAYVGGHSLGEYSALAAAGTFSLSDTARLLKIRGKAMQSAVSPGRGAMAAVLGLSFEDAFSVASQAAESHTCVIANDNSPGQQVLSGHKDAVERAIEIAKSLGAKRSLLLPVSAPFHCPLMQPAADAMADALGEASMHNPIVPLIANVRADEVTDADTIRGLLVEQVTGMVRWRESVEKMAELGVTELVELGSGKVLTGLTKRIVSDLEGRALNTPQDIENYLKGE